MTAVGDDVESRARDAIGEQFAVADVDHRVGGADTVIDTRNGELLAERIPNARLRLVPGRGHLLVWEEPGLVAPAVLEFLRG